MVFVLGVVLVAAAAIAPGPVVAQNGCPPRQWRPETGQQRSQSDGSSVQSARRLDRSSWNSTANMTTRLMVVTTANVSNTNVSLDEIL
jgi:hypothetical protein